MLEHHYGFNLFLKLAYQTLSNLYDSNLLILPISSNTETVKLYTMRIAMAMENTPSTEITHHSYNFAFSNSTKRFQYSSNTINTKCTKTGCYRSLIVTISSVVSTKY